MAEHRVAEASQPAANGMLGQANAAFQAGDWVAAAQGYWQAALAQPKLWPYIEHNLHWLRHAWLKERQARLRQGERPSVGVSCWSLGHNPAGRAITLLEAWQPQAAKVEIIGSLFPSFGSELWPPMQPMKLPCHAFVCQNEADFMRDAMELVLRHPYDIVHVSKPRLPSIVFARLYQLVWGARVILDIDDEELAFTNQEMLQAPPVPEAFQELHKTAWTHWAVGQIDAFAERTVSNPALQARYGGEILPHVRPQGRFQPSVAARRAARRRWGIPENAKVVLFAGTPRQHKGLIPTAEALAALNDPDLWLVVAGDFPRGLATLKKTLNTMPNLRCLCIPGTAYDKVAEVVALGDLTLLLQDTESLAAQFQLPAKLMDALAMGLHVMATPTPPLQPMVAAGVVTPVTEATLAEQLKAWLGLSPQAASEQGHRNRTYFREHLSVEALQPTVQRLQQRVLNAPLHAGAKSPPHSWDSQLRRLIDDPFHFAFHGSSSQPEGAKSYGIG